MITKVKNALLIAVRTIHMKLGVLYRGVHVEGAVADVSLFSNVYGKTGGSVFLAKGVKIMKNTTIAAVKGKIELGKKCYIGRNCSIIAHDRISIGEYCMFGPGVVIYDHDHLFDGTGVLSQGYKEGEVSIGARCWLGANVIILRGTQIGEGCVIGAGTVVSGEIAPHSLVTNERNLIIKQIDNSSIKS